jgi:DNA anti-recombination protein RmuC
MRRLVFAALTALLVTPGVVASAQFPGGGSHMGVGRSPGRDDPAMKEIGAALELRLANGVNIIIAHAKDLSLTSEQLGRVAVIKRRLDSLNTPLMRELDSLERAHRNRGEPQRSRGDLPEPSDPAIDQTLESLRTNMHAAEQNAYEVLSGSQLQQALQMVKEARTNAALTVGKDRAPR